MVKTPTGRMDARSPSVLPEQEIAVTATCSAASDIIANGQTIFSAMQKPVLASQKMVGKAPTMVSRKKIMVLKTKNMVSDTSTAVAAFQKMVADLKTLFSKPENIV
jgi:hypothetical protein